MPVLAATQRFQENPSTATTDSESISVASLRKSDVPLSTSVYNLRTHITLREIKMAGLSTHILDTSIGKPAANVKIELFEADSTTPTVTCHTNSDGRTDAPLIDAGNLTEGTYELRFHAGDYFKTHNSINTESIPFLDVVVIRFGISQTDQHYHVPLLLSPYGYSTYRGS